VEKGDKMERVVILANGKFPEADIPRAYLGNADKIICCDGAVENLVARDFEPDAIVGDMDSISDMLKERYANILYPDSDESSNDLSKAVKYCISAAYTDITILGSSGYREDHTLGNISLLAEYSEYLAVRMVTDTGIFVAVNSGERISSFPGQQVSIFSFLNRARVDSKNLKYPLEKLLLDKIWTGTLNECTSDFFSLSFDKGPLVVFLAF
jgi:thiamine pyrophosphokinase